MNFEKLTDRARGFLQAAQTIAVREHQQRIAPAHLLKALLDDEQGMAAGLINAAGGDATTAQREADALVAKIPAVTGSGATQAPAMDGDTIRILDQAEQVAKKSGDSYVTVERILLAMALAKNSDVGAARQRAAHVRILRQRHRQQDALDGHVAVASLGRDLLGLVEDADRVAVQRGRLRSPAAGHGRDFRNQRIGLSLGGLGVAACSLDQSGRHALLVVEQRLQQMRGRDPLMMLPDGDGLRSLQKPARAIRQLFKVH
jgi:hypothetical protein